MHGKCKNFNDDLSAALELAMQRGISEVGISGKKEALSRLLGVLLAEGNEHLESEHLKTLDEAIIYVATALELGGTSVDLDSSLATVVNSRRDEFLSRSVQSKPIGFWNASEELRDTFTQDRYLMTGFSIREKTGVCAILAAAISRHPELAETFKRVRDFYASLTNPPRHVSQVEPLARAAASVSAADLAKWLPPDASIGDVLQADSLETLRFECADAFGPDAAFELVSYSASKEYGLLLELAANGRLLASNWITNLRSDPDLARDTRVAVPIMVTPDEKIRYWATGGIRLERVRYSYEEEPMVTGVVPVFVPSFYYAPSDISVEFARGGASPLTREEFRALCDSCASVDRLVELIAGLDEKNSDTAFHALQRYRYQTCGTGDSGSEKERFDPVLLEAARNLAFGGSHRSQLAAGISGAEAARLAFESLLLHPTGSEPWQHERCHTQGAEGLAALGADAAPAIPSLLKVLSDPAISANVRAKVKRAIERIEAEK